MRERVREQVERRREATTIQEIGTQLNLQASREEEIFLTHETGVWSGRDRFRFDCTL